MTTDKNFIVTHYIRQTPDPNGWIQLPFITQISGSADSEYFFTFDVNDPLSSEFILENETNDLYKRLVVQVPIRSDQSLWLTPSEEIYLADIRKPFDGPRLLLESNFSSLDLSTTDFGLLQKLGLDKKHVDDEHLPSEMKYALEMLLNRLKYYPSEILLTEVPNYSVFTSNYIKILERGLNKNLRKVLENKNGLLGHLIDCTNNFHYDIMESGVFFDTPSVFLYPFFLDRDRNDNVGVIPYASQKTVAIIIHEASPLYERWAEKRSDIEYLMKDSGHSGLNGESSQNFKNAIYDSFIDDAFCVAWLSDLIKYTYEDKGVIHSIKGYVFQSIIRQFIKEHNLINQVIPSNNLIIPSFDFHSTLVELQYFRSRHNKKNPLRECDILVHDPAEALGLTRNGGELLDKLEEDFKIIYVKHGMNVPVGVGFSLYALPRILKSQVWKDLHTHALQIVKQHASLLALAGISVHGAETNVLELSYSEINK